MPAEDPKPDAVRAGEDPKPDAVRAGEDPKPDAVRGAGAPGDHPFGCGGWGVVAFIGPVGLNVPELALRALRSERGGVQPSGRRHKALGRVFTIADSAARKEALRQEQTAKQLKMQNYLAARAKGKTPP